MGGIVAIVVRAFQPAVFYLAVQGGCSRAKRAFQ
jgi:hypothetical protein